MILLVHPPVAKPGEPPAGIAALAGALHRRGLPHALLDANLEALFFLLNRAEGGNDTWSVRALKHRHAHLAALRDPATYQSPDRYRRAVLDCNRVLACAARKFPHISLGLANYQDQCASPLRSADLLRAAKEHRSHLLFPWFSKRLSRLLAEINPDTVGISLCFLSQALCTFALLGFLRATAPGLRLILGGGLITSWMADPSWRNPFAGLVDHCIAGPGEQALPELLGSRAVVDDDALPRYVDLEMDRYLAPGPITPYAASRGCAWNRCTFCPEPAEQSRYLPVPPDTAAGHLRELVVQTRPLLLHLLDNALSPALMRALIDRPPGAPWYGFVRAGEELADPDFCRCLRLSGCVLLKLGFESGSQAVLDAMGKGIRLSLMERVLAALHQVGIATYIYLLFGTPAESPAEARATLDFTVRHHQEIGFLNLAIFNMPRFGVEAARLGSRPFSHGDLSLYTDFIHPRGWNRRQVRAFLDREFRRHPAIQPILRRDPPLFTSNHAALFTPGMFF